MALTASPPVSDRLDPARLTTIPSRSFLPWTSDATLRTGLANGAALGLIVTSWFLISGATALRTQTYWLELAIAALMVSGVVNGLWLLRGRRAVGAARVALLAEFERGVAAGPQPVDGTGPLVSGTRMTRFHAAGCSLVAGKVVTAADRSDHLAAGRRPCEACRP